MPRRSKFGVQLNKRLPIQLCHEFDYLYLFACSLCSFKLCIHIGCKILYMHVGYGDSLYQ